MHGLPVVSILPTVLSYVARTKNMYQKQLPAYAVMLGILFVACTFEFW